MRFLLSAAVIVGACGGSTVPYEPIAADRSPPPPTRVVGAGTHSCSATIGCYSACPTDDQGCFESCEASATMDAYHASHVVLDCLVREHCYSESCARKACPDELQLCGLWLATVRTSLKDE